MVDEDRARKLSRLLGRAGRAHHAEFGGPNPGWPEWYAEHIHPEVSAHLGHEPTVHELADWLREADERHLRQASDEPWPQFYARLFLESHSATS